MNDQLPINIVRPIVEKKSFCNVLPSAEKVDGMIFAVAACPEIPMPEQWMPWLIQSASSQLVDSDVDILADTLMNGLRAHLDFMRQGRIALPPHCMETIVTTDAGKEEMIKPSSALSQWLNGLLIVHKNVEPVWQNAWQLAEKKQANIDRLNHEDAEEKAANNEGEAPEVQLSRCLKLFTTLANIDLAYQQRQPQHAEQLSKNLPILVKQLPALLKDYTTLAGDLAGALPNQFEMFTKKEKE
ncbi:MAG: hypothetical protein CL600_01240 [Alteromonas sp.]|nr:hypothetical protein [Alteromonas sp.]